ncbi:MULTISPECIES: winged helix-turn-helix transcriptional regulator [Streptomyces]|jgi:DNA-binding HxlR family transcriptional regulator|uniref:Transcriptional regulator, HxlR family n=2 Tax=Streptomyces griseoaurantiacus TaxID=68213 RepID=F3NTE7_9ACTN|nr:MULTISPECIES: helix-turn-helix domain-containing protein [Streptomyces]EGG43107.1 Transcriptional regulator, HxlR family [Streptomyces griseoaurantiacus M045]NJP72934.1 helix-turn-helix transcriptional regulator [Streptomyces sp. C1-2]GHE30281.1 HxlR family transcriptional regulator [Streptomyces griseoaurantiacus]SDG23172.1 transcriptional regulator, HxlR family [Streptomyces jietaisiensis]
MSRFATGDVFLSDCPGRLPFEMLADKWSVVVLAGLGKGPVRHGELAAMIGGISRKVLTQTLRRLQAHGLVSRHSHAEVPPRVEYALTPLGQTLIEPIHMLTEWAREHGEAVLDALEAAPDPAPADH